MIPTPYALALMIAADEAFVAGRLEEAANAFKLAVGNSGDDSVPLYHLGHIQNGLRQFVESEVALRCSVTMDATRASAFNDLAATLFVLGRDAEALNFINQACFKALLKGTRSAYHRDIFIPCGGFGLFNSTFNSVCDKGEY